MALDIGIRVGIDFDMDGTIDWTGYDNISPYLLSATWGIGASSPSAPIGAEGVASVKVNNYTRVFSPEYSGGTYYDKLGPNLESAIEIQDSGGTWNRVWSGYLEEIHPEPGNRDYTTDLQFTQGMFRIEELRYTPELLYNYTTDQIIRYLLDNGGWVPHGILRWILGSSTAGVLGSTTILNNTYEGYLFTTGQNTFSYYGEVWKQDNETQVSGSVRSRIENLCEAERGFFWLDRDGYANFLDRHSLLAQSAGNGRDYNGDGFICKNVSESDALNILQSPIELPEATYGYGIASGMTSAIRQEEVSDYGKYVVECQTGTGVYNGHELGRNTAGTFTGAIPISPSTQYTVVVWAKGITGYSGVPFTVDVYDQNPTLLNSTSIAGGLNSTWTRYAVTFTTGVSSTSLLLQFKKNNDATDVTFRTTGWMLVAGATGPTAFNAGGVQDYLEDSFAITHTINWDSGANAGDYEYGTDLDLYNDIIVKYYPKYVWTNKTILSNTDGWSVSAGESREVKLRFSDETRKITPTSITSVGLTVTSGSATSSYVQDDLDGLTVTITASSDAEISTITVTGNAIVSESAGEYQTENAASIARYRRRAKTLDFKEIATYAQAQNLGDDYLLRHKDPRGRFAKITMKARDGTWLDNMIAIKPGSAIVLSETQTALTSVPHIVVGEQWTFQPGILSVTYTTVDSDSNLYWILGSSRLDSTTILGA